MEIIKGNCTTELVCIHFKPGEKFLEGLKEVIEKENIRAGVILSGIGSFSTCHIRQTNCGTPPNLETRCQDYYKFDGSVELSSVQGLIADGEPHLHVTVSEHYKTIGGHLEEGCIVLTLAEVVILKANELPVTRVVRPPKLKQLTGKY